jgi:tetratricopeptide (TPR) repeat protein
MAIKSGKTNDSGRQKPLPGGVTDNVVFGLSGDLETLLRDVISKANKFGASLDKLGLDDRLTPHLKRLEGIVTQHEQITAQFASNINIEKEESIVSKDISKISEGFVQRTAHFGSALDAFKTWQSELRQLIGETLPGAASRSQTTGPPPRPSFNSLIVDYMGQLQFLSGIVSNFGNKVQACDACMGAADYETLIKSYEEVLKNEGELLSTLEALLKSKNELMSNIAKDQEDLLESYEKLTKSAIEVESGRLDLLNKPLKKTLELAGVYEELIKSLQEVLKNLKELLVLPAKNVEELTKSYAEIAKMVEELIKSVFGLRVASTGRIPLSALGTTLGASATFEGHL